jgi:hypothetical protein
VPRTPYEHAQAALERFKEAQQRGQHDGAVSAEFSARARAYFQASRSFHRFTGERQTDLGQLRWPAARPELGPPWPYEREWCWSRWTISAVSIAGTDRGAAEAARGATPAKPGAL